MSAERLLERIPRQQDATLIPVTHAPRVAGIVNLLPTDNPDVVAVDRMVASARIRRGNPLGIQSLELRSGLHSNDHRKPSSQSRPESLLRLHSVTLQPTMLQGFRLGVRRLLLDRKSTRLNSSHSDRSRMPSSA